MSEPKYPKPGPPPGRRCAIKGCRRWSNKTVQMISPDAKLLKAMILKRGYGVEMCFPHWLEYSDLVGQRWSG